jgi:hypothetical protein
MNLDDRDDPTTARTYPHVFMCGGCRRQHVALAFENYELDYLQSVLAAHREITIDLMNNETDIREKRFLRKQISFIDFIADHINQIEHECDR